jgi:hypothetical protein
MSEATPILRSRFSGLLRSRARSATQKDFANQIFGSQLFANHNDDARETFFATMAAQLLARLCLFNTSVPIPKFVSVCGALVRTSESKRTLAKLFLLAPPLNPKFASGESESLCELRFRGTSRQSAEKYHPPRNTTWRRRAWRSVRSVLCLRLSRSLRQRRTRRRPIWRTPPLTVRLPVESQFELPKPPPPLTPM